MPKSMFVDFKAIKAAVTMEQVLDRYGLLDKFKRSGDSLSGPCPIHKGSNPTQFRVSISKNVFNTENTSIKGMMLSSASTYSTALEPDNVFLRRRAINHLQTGLR